MSPQTTTPVSSKSKSRSKASKSIRVPIANPVGGCGHTNLEHARRYVRRGRARFLPDGRLEFIDSHHHQSAAAACRRVLFHGGMATVRAVEGLPVAGDALRLFMGHRDPSLIDRQEWDVPAEHPSAQPLRVRYMVEAY